MPTNTTTNSETQAETWLTPEQIDALRDACLSAEFATYLQDRNETIIAVLADTGLRVSELVALDWPMVSLDGTGPLIELPPEIQKGGGQGIAPLGLATDTARQLRRWRRDRWKETTAVFPSRQSDRITPRQVENIVTDVATVAGVKPKPDYADHDPEAITPHTFRHSIAYRLIRVEEKRLEDVQLRLRHASRSTTEQVYGHIRLR